MELEQWGRMRVGRTESPTQWFDSKGCGVNESGQESTSTGPLVLGAGGGVGHGDWALELTHDT